MMKSTALSAFVIAAATASPALAVQITNVDTEPRVVEIYEGENVSQVTIAAGETRQDLCPAGCSLLTDDSALDELQGGESIMIRGGLLEIQQ